MNTFDRLLEQFIPKHYSLKIDLTKRKEREFRGVVTITGNLPKDGSDIKLHAHELDILQATIDDVGAGATASKQDDTVTLHSNLPLKAGEHVISVEFTGAITDPMHGLYPSYFKLDSEDKELLATQFESHHAREAFPCIDEPSAKATFDLMLVTEPGITTIANTPVKEQQETDGNLVTTFETSPKMSTYLLAWVTGDLGYTEAKTKDDVTVRIYCTPNKVEQTKFALDTAVKVLEFYNQYFAIDYPLPKCDMIALPDFSSGAMENWGCITYRETGLLCDDKNTSLSRKQYIAMVIAHELAHQWFGNLVTMKWWDDLWLNESFATWIEFLACNHIFPDWKLWTQFFTDETMNALDRDGLASVQKVRQEVNNPEEIRTLFDSAIVYAKGANLLNMLHSYLGADDFRDGLRIYLKRHQYGNTDSSDLWQALDEASGKDVGTFMQPWTSQPGHPVVSVDFADQAAKISQKRFFSNPKEGRNDSTIWPVPLLGNGELDKELLNSQETTAKITSDTLTYLNHGRSGFYLTAYSKDHTAKLADAVKKGKLAEIDRLGLLNDNISLNSAGLQPISQNLQLLEAYRQEDSEPVWAAIADQIGSLKMLVSEDEELKAKLRKFVGQLADTQYKRLGWQRIANESVQDELLRPSIVGMKCFSEEPEVLKYAKNLFNQATQPEDILSEIRGIIFATATKHGGVDEFEKLLGWYRATNSAEERIRIAAGICSTEKPELIERVIKMLISDEVKLQDLFYWFVYLIRNRHARQQAWKWMQDNWQWITKNFGNDMHYTEFPRYSASAFSTPEQLELYRQFFTPKLDLPALERTIRQGFEDIEARVLWRQRDIESLAAYLRSI